MFNREVGLLESFVAMLPFLEHRRAHNQFSKQCESSDYSERCGKDEEAHNILSKEYSLFPFSVNVMDIVEMEDMKFVSFIILVFFIANLIKHCGERLIICTAIREYY